jgi:lipid-A-disaccharide synthase
MLVILPFEQDYYERHGVEVDYVGHPLLDSVSVTATRGEFCFRHQLNSLNPIIALLPGSRHSEIKYILPPLLEAAALLNQSHPQLQFIIPIARTFAPDEVASRIGPLIVVYRASSLNWRIFHPLINTPFVGMPNLIAGKEIAPELLQDDLNGGNLAKLIIEFLNDPARLRQSRDDLAKVREKLGEARASERAASKILDLLEV